MKIRYIAILLLIAACGQKPNSHPVYIPFVNNFVRDIEHTGDFKVLREWIEVLQRQPIVSGNGKLTYAALEAVNINCNKKPYKINSKWPTPKEFMDALDGDCKGYAICKYYALRKAGWKASQLNLWSGDYNHRAHMMLVAELNGKQYVLDIGSESDLPEAKDYFYKNFQPAYRFNENGWDVN